MEKILIGIITVIFIFSIANQTFAQKNQIFEKILDIKYGVEDYEIQLANIDTMYFYDKNLRNMYNDFNRANEQIKKEIITYYRDGRFTKYQTQGLIIAHKNFVYSTNQIFRHLKYKELDPNFTDVDSAILKNYKQSRIAYNKIIKIVELRY